MPYGTLPINKQPFTKSKVLEKRALDKEVELSAIAYPVILDDKDRLSDLNNC